MMKLDNIYLLGSIKNLAIFPSIVLPTLENTKVGQFILFDEKLYFNSGQRIVTLDVNELSTLALFFGALMNQNWTFNSAAATNWTFSKPDGFPQNLNDVFQDISDFFQQQGSGSTQFDTVGAVTTLSVSHNRNKVYLPVTVIDRVTKVKLRDDEYTVTYVNSNNLVVTTTVARNFTVLVG